TQAEKGLNNLALARLAGVYPSMITRMHKVGRIRVDNLAKIAAVLGLDLASLVIESPAAVDSAASAALRSNSSSPQEAAA
ncbi:MAG TPA: helix-turn-helix transcriptional regulator, partial [Candidatus Omnitrophota bacterium]|nr:helix-turn-helix transcriptional regulator [Candidatus Omnitrophota bacterium]